MANPLDNFVDKTTTGKLQPKLRPLPKLKDALKNKAIDQFDEKMEQWRRELERLLEKMKQE